METIITRFIVVVVSWIAGATATYFSKENDVMFLPFLVTVGWSLSHMS